MRGASVMRRYTLPPPRHANRTAGCRTGRRPPLTADETDTLSWARLLLAGQTVPGQIPDEARATQRGSSGVGHLAAPIITDLDHLLVLPRGRLATSISATPPLRSSAAGTGSAFARADHPSGLLARPLCQCELISFRRHSYPHSGP